MNGYITGLSSSDINGRSTGSSGSSGSLNSTRSMRTWSHLDYISPYDPSGRLSKTASNEFIGHQIGKLETNIASLKSNVDGLNTNISDLKNSMTNLKTKSADLDDAVRQLKLNIWDLDRHLKDHTIERSLPMKLLRRERLSSSQKDFLFFASICVVGLTL